MTVPIEPKTGSDSGSTASSANRKTTGSTVPDPQSFEENGRTYTAYRDGKYFMPNDGDEQDRLDLQHHLWLLFLDGELSCAPVEAPKHVLDIGTGTGIWAIQFAERHPESKVIGTDLSLIQPSSAPPNCSFVREDSEEEWIFDEKFDFVHLRAVCSCFHDHKGVMQKIFDNMVPGGWVEYQDFAFESIAADADSQLEIEKRAPVTYPNAMRRFIQGGRVAGRDFEVTRKYKSDLEDVGFVDVVEKRILCPTNPWPSNPRERQMGQYMMENSINGLAGAKRVLMAAGMTEQEAAEYINGVIAYMRDVSIRSYVAWYVVYGRKPDASERESAYPDPER